MFPDRLINMTASVFDANKERVESCQLRRRNEQVIGPIDFKEPTETLTGTVIFGGYWF
jgi:hypothetical protein